ncbi:hypothetical protein DMJ13_16170 [halophilic archaeon]|nr:hypothetical protein DMJ13_16170 [halophilic archaeon]
MARETAFDRMFMGAVGIGAAAAVGARALEYYRERRRQNGARVICTDCGESMPVDDVLDPVVTCSCVAGVRTE